MPERRNLTLILSITLYLISMFFVSIYGKNEAYLNAYGFLTFVMGGIYLFLEPSLSTLLIFLIWLANPILFLAWIYIKRPKRSYSLSLISSLLSLSFIFWNYDDKTLGPGYFIWLSSSIIMLIGSFSILKIAKV